MDVKNVNIFDFFLNEKLKSCNAFLKIQMLYHIVPKHLEHQFMFKAVSCWVGHLGCKLDEFDHDISTFRKKEDFMVPKQNSSTLLLPLIFENCMSY